MEQSQAIIQSSLEAVKNSDVSSDEAAGNADSISTDEDEDEISQSVEKGSGEDDEAKKEKGVGMADVISKLLGQSVGKSNPVLAKRKTKMMKEREAQATEKKELYRRQLENKEKKERALVKPEITALPYERQLKKVATRGVVALFNAIAKHQRGVSEDEASKSGKESSGTAKTATKSGFLDMLKGSPEDLTKTDDKDENTVEKSNKVNSTWAALDDNYMMETKGWDQVSDSEGNESAGDEIDFGDSDDGANNDHSSKKGGKKRAATKKSLKAKKKNKKQKQ